MAMVKLDRQTTIMMKMIVFSMMKVRHIEILIRLIKFQIIIQLPYGGQTHMMPTYFLAITSKALSGIIWIMIEIVMILMM